MEKQDWVENIRHTMAERQIHTVRVCLHDSSNVQRARFVSARHFLDHVLEGGIAYPSIMFSLDVAANLVEDAGEGYAGGYPSWLVKPDLSTFSVIPYADGIARVIADVYRKEGEVLDTLPRYVLKKVLEKYKEKGIHVKGAFEYEFFIFKKNGEALEPSWSGLNSLSELKQAAVEEIIVSILNNLTEMGAGPEVANTEYASGQFEITNSPFWGIEIADMAYYYRTSIKEIVAKFGLAATFMAKPNAKQSGSGAHIHISLYDDDGNNLMYDSTAEDGLSALCRSFIGGQIENGRPLCSLVNSTLNSYKRLQPHRFAPTNCTWGYEHRGCMIRVPQARGLNTHIENRLAGADANPYIALAAILAAGLDGIEKGTQPGEPMTNKDAYLSQAVKLPETLSEGISELKKDTLFRSILGENFIDHYIKLRENEIHRFNQFVTDWEFQEYFELI